MADAKKDIFNEDNVVTSNWWTLEKFGDTLAGVYVDRITKMNNLKNPPVEQAIYTIYKDDGTTILVGGRYVNKINGKEIQVLPGLESCKFGEYVGLKYVKQLPPSKAGNQGAKIVNVYTEHKMNEDVLNTYRGVDMNQEPSDNEM